jgi:CheY-like chemotaxis protein
MPSNVLLIDDGIIDNYIFETVLKRTRKEVTTTICSNGKIAIEKLEEMKQSDTAVFPEYIIVDITMPTMDGWEFLNEYKRLNIDLGLNSKVYIITSSIFATDYNRSLGYTFVNGFIIKPINTKTMSKILS